MGSNRKSVMEKVLKAVVPQLSSGSHKGQAGKIGVIGGCFEYTGAPYFSAIASLRLGADLSHVFCESSAATAIKSYSPDLIVHPVLPSSYTLQSSSGSPSKSEDSVVEEQAKKVADWFSRLHALVVGPGLGRDPVTLRCVTLIIQRAREEGLPLVIDGDGLSIITEQPDLIRGYAHGILTPNVNEYKRLAKALSLSEEDTTPEEIAQKLDNVTIVRKGSKDVITDGRIQLVCDEEGSLRRVGGQGDILTGAIGTFMTWAKDRKDKWAEVLNSSDIDEELKRGLSPTIVAGYGGCVLTRTSGRLAFQRNRRATITSDMIQHLGEAFELHFPFENAPHSSL